jgi:hypothetical protein
VQDARLGNPLVQQWGKSLPPHLCSLTVPDENTPPQPVDTLLKDAQLSRVWISTGKVLSLTAGRAVGICAAVIMVLLFSALTYRLRKLRDVFLPYAAVWR